MMTEFHNKRPTTIEDKLNPPESIISTIRLLYSVETKSDAGGCLIDLALYDKNKKLLLKTYSFDTSKRLDDIAEHVITLDDDERVFGFISR